MTSHPEEGGHSGHMGRAPGQDVAPTPGGPFNASSIHSADADGLNDEFTDPQNAAWAQE